MLRAQNPENPEPSTLPATASSSNYVTTDVPLRWRAASSELLQLKPLVPKARAWKATRNLVQTHLSTRRALKSRTIAHQDCLKILNPGH